MIKLPINIKIDWIEHKTDLRECMGCNDVIYGIMYRLCFPTPQYRNRTDTVCCESCKDEIKNEG